MVLTYSIDLSQPLFPDCINIRIEQHRWRRVGWHQFMTDENFNSQRLFYLNAQFSAVPINLIVIIDHYHLIAHRKNICKGKMYSKEFNGENGSQ